MEGKPKRVALMLELQWPYKRHSEVFSGTQIYANTSNWHSIIDEYAHLTLASHSKTSLPYDGVIARTNLALAQQSARLGIPVVNIWASSPVRAQVPGVYADAREAGRLCAEHLLVRGFRNFGTLTSPRNLFEGLLVGGFIRVVANAGFQVDSQQFPQNPNQTFAKWRKTEHLIEQWMCRWKPPIGVYVGQEDTGRLVVQMCHRRGWRVPEDVAIIAGQNQEALCEHPRPSLTSLELGYERIGYEAAKLLDQLMRGEGPPTDPILLAPQGLVVRESTDFFAVDDELVASALSYISANSHRPIGPTDVARAVGAETRTLQNYFQKFLARPIATEIRRVRIERAKRELAQGKRPLADIALAVGFGSIQRLYEVFLREVGVTPSEYRKQRKTENEL